VQGKTVEVVVFPLEKNDTIWLLPAAGITEIYIFYLTLYSLSLFCVEIFYQNRKFSNA
jgi:hypothetical protein